MAPTRQEIMGRLARAWVLVCDYGKPIVHVAFIPAILALGMAYTEPRPSLVQLLAPM